MVTKSEASPCVVVLGTGGTIAGQAASAGDNLGYVAGQIGVEALVQQLALPDGLTLKSEQVAQLDSKDMDFSVWQALAARCSHWLARDDVAGVVITHGTDTLEETAFFLQWVLAPTKPVVLTCAMRPATALAPDGPQNLRDAIAVAATPGPHGVMAVCAGTVHGAFDVQKVHTYRLDAFASGDAGPLGYVEERAVRWLRTGPDNDREAARRLACVLRTDVADWPRVEILTSHAGSGGRLVEALLQERRSGVAQAVQGLVLAATGNGSLHQGLESAALTAQEEGVAVVRATRCCEGRILATPQAVLRDAGALTPVKARIALMLALLLAMPGA